MKATILHDEHGHIISISKIGDLKAAGSKFTKVSLVPGPGQRLVELSLSEEHAHRPLRELHAEFRIDTSKSSLVKKHP